MKRTEEGKELLRKNRNEKNYLEHLKFELTELRRHYFYGEPTIVFNVGDRVQRGNIEKTIITEVLDGGRIYKVHNTSITTHYGKTSIYENDSYISWTDIEPYVSSEENSLVPIFKEDDDFHLSASSRQVSSLLITYWHSGIDTEQDYQRGNIWTPEQELMLIDSIFRNIQIGSFVLIHREYKENEKSYEIVDGKQRLLTLVKFAESRFPFNGLLYRNMNKVDRNHFENYMISWIEVRNLTQKEKYRLFLKMNTCGKPQEQAHIEKVKNLLRES